MFDALRERNFEQGTYRIGARPRLRGVSAIGVLWSLCGGLGYSLNDALRRLEGLTSYYVMSGDGKTLQNYYAELENGLGRIGKDLGGIVGFCKRKLAQG